MTKSRKIRRKRLPRLPIGKLDLYRTNAGLERVRKISAYIVCRECGARRQYLDKTHLSAHGLTAKQYREKWDNPPLYATTWLKQHNKSGIRWRQANPEKAKAIQDNYYDLHGREKSLAYKNAHREKINAALRARRKTDRKLAKKLSKKSNAWAEAHPEQVRARGRKRSARHQRLKNLEGLDLKTGLRASLVAHRLITGETAYAMAPDIYPESSDPHNAIKTFLRRFEPIVQIEKHRIGKLPEAVRKAEAAELAKRLPGAVNI